MVTTLGDLQKQIQTHAKLPGGGAYWASAQSLFQKPVVTHRGNLIAAAASPGTQTQQVGDQPTGFGKGFIWDRHDAAIILALFINAADPLGVSISGVEAGDTLTITSCAGIASFSKDKGNPLVSSLIGLVAAGAKAVVTAVGQPELAPIVAAADTFAEAQFKATGAAQDLRDAFGIDPGSGQKARQEGGILISLPEAGGPSYSGDNDHQDRWIKKPGDRTDADRPPQVPFGFFPLPNSTQNTRVLGASGQVYVTPWDFEFDDNAGYYKVFLQISKPDPNAPPVIIERQNHIERQNRHA